MTAEPPALRATPFHARAAGANRYNSWVSRHGVTLAACYDDVGAEALGARLAVAIGDISWRWRIVLEGAHAAEMLSRLVTRDAAALAPGASLKALWLSDGGGVRGDGIIARVGKDSFQLIAAAPDGEWIAAAAASYGVSCRDVSAETGGLAIIGRYARETLAACGIADEIEPLGFRKLSWRGIEVTLSRWGDQDGYEIWCVPDDGVLVWDRLMRAGERFAILPAGIAALDVLDIEAGIACPHLDYAPARDGDAARPGPRALGLDSLVDAAHFGFNGRAAYLAAREHETKTLAGMEIASDTPAPFTPLMRNGAPVGHTLRSVYSPALRRAIALASLEIGAAAPGTILSLTLPPSFATPVLRQAVAHVTCLPFLASAGPIGA